MGSADSTRTRVTPGSEPASLSTLSRYSIRSGAFTLASTGIQVAIGITALVVLARVLTPADFGVVAMTAPVTGFALMLRDFGLSLAVTHHSDLDAHQVRQLYRLNLKLNVLLAAVVAATGPLLGWFYGQPSLVDVTLVQAVGLLILSLNTIPIGLLRRQMRFGVLAGIEAGSMVIGVLVAIGIAALGGGVWALVMMNLVAWAVMGLAPFLFGPWRGLAAPRAPDRSAAGVRSLIAFGTQTTGVKVITTVSEQAPFVLVGYFGGPGPLGVFQKAFQFSAQPFFQIYLALLNVGVAAFSQLRHDPGAYRDAVRKGLLALFSLTLPALAFLTLVAHDVVMLVLGPQWEDAAAVLRILATGMIGGAVTWATRWVYFSEGRPRDLLAWMLVSTPVVIAMTAAGAFWGYLGVAVGYSTALCVLCVPSVWWCLRGSSLRGPDFQRAVGRPAAATGLASVVVLAAGACVPEPASAFLRILTSGALFGVVYGIGWIGLPGGRRECSELVLRHLRGRGGRENRAGARGHARGSEGGGGDDISDTTRAGTP
jgi:PST family polysaccharide transporter